MTTTPSGFGKARSLINQIERLIEIHGEQLEIAFYLSDDEALQINDSVIGPIKFDRVEETRIPRADLSFA